MPRISVSRAVADRSRYPAIATQDEGILNLVKRFAADRAIAPHDFEFQMLYGIRRDLQRKLRDDGYRMRGMCRSARSGFRISCGGSVNDPPTSRSCSGLSIMNGSLNAKRQGREEWASRCRPWVRRYSEAARRAASDTRSTVHDDAPRGSGRTSGTPRRAACCTGSCRHSSASTAP